MNWRCFLLLLAAYEWGMAQDCSGFDAKLPVTPPPDQPYCDPSGIVSFGYETETDDLSQHLGCTVLSSISIELVYTVTCTTTPGPALQTIRSTAQSVSTALAPASTIVFSTTAWTGQQGSTLLVTAPPQTVSLTTFVRRKTSTGKVTTFSVGKGSSKCTYSATLIDNWCTLDDWFFGKAYTNVWAPGISTSVVIAGTSATSQTTITETSASTITSAPTVPADIPWVTVSCTTSNGQTLTLTGPGSTVTDWITINSSALGDSITSSSSTDQGSSPTSSLGSSLADPLITSPASSPNPAQTSSTTACHVTAVTSLASTTTMAGVETGLCAVQSGDLGLEPTTSSGDGGPVQNLVLRPSSLPVSSSVVPKSSASPFLQWYRMWSVFLLAVLF